jgi:hypothetical protein
VRDDRAPAQAAEVGERRPAPVGVPLEERGHPAREGGDHVRPDGVVEHGRGGDLDGAAAEQEVVEGVLERGDPADAGELAVREGLRHLGHLGQRQGQDRGAAHAAGGHVAVHVDLGVQGVGIERGQRRERIGRDDRVGTAAERGLGLLHDVGGGRRELDPHRDLRDRLDRLG